MREVALMVLAIAAFAAPSFCLPLRGDETTYLMVAEDLVEGEVLYRDTWDIANPGIFVWYAVAGMLFGFTEEGVRLFDLIWQIAFALTIAGAVRRSNNLERLPILPGLVVVGLYYLAGYSNTNHLARTEALAVFPLFVAVYGASIGSRWWLIAAGPAAGMVFVFKMLLAGVVAAAWVWLLVDYLRTGRPALKTALTLIAGLLVPITALVGYFAVHDGALAEAWWSMMHVPRHSMAEIEPAGLARLAAALQWFAGNFAGPAAVAVIGVACRWRLANDPFVSAWLIGLVAAVFVVLSQTVTWWVYHWMLPAGMIAVLVGYTLPAILTTATGLDLPRRSGRVGVLAACAAILPLLLAGGYITLHAAQHRLGITAADRKAARMALGNGYRRAETEAAWLRDPARKPGAVYICHDPTIYRFSGREPGNRFPGWAIQMWPKSVRDKIEAEFVRELPVYVFLGRAAGFDFPKVVPERYPTMAAVLASDYRMVRETPDGIWYEQKD